ncbi:chloride channel protein C-like [Babylonia areolata]|uniref:chloride channel protein C-like n=1 Tax=Babylonia areolata TaxID=304850 RepID=UPI003FCF700D
MISFEEMDANRQNQTASASEESSDHSQGGLIEVNNDDDDSQNGDVRRLSDASVTVRPRKSSTITKYGALTEPPSDDSVFYVNDDDFGIFAAGRDYEPVYITHKYTTEEKETLASFESLDYLPSHSQVYKHWMKRQMVSRLQLDRWVMMGLIGFVVGVVGFLLHQLIEQIADVKWNTTETILKDGKSPLAWLFTMGYSVAFVLFSTAIIIFWRPSAGGSGIPEVTGYLNGTHIRHIFSLKTMAAKFLSCVTAIGCGMPVGPEGPMIHLGALVGAGVSQARSETLQFRLPFFERFRNSEDRRNFVSAGAAAGVASAFGAPVGGLLFSMEEVSSFWTTTLSWQIFFCCMVSTFTTDLFNSAFEGFTYTGNFGQFKTERYILFNIDQGVDVNILMFIPTVIIGVLGGGLGALFTIINLKVARVRRRCLARMEAKWKQNVFRMAEPAVLMVIVSTLSLFLPAAFSCSEYTCLESGATSISKNCLNDSTNAYQVSYDLTKDYTCTVGTVWQHNTTWFTNSTYNELATLLFGTTEHAVKQLFTRNTHQMFGYPSLVVGLVFYFLFVCWACGTSVASGILVPMLLIGSLYGRIVGLGMVSLFGIHLEEDSYWKWMDPGAFALIGAASFMGGVTRLTLTVTVIMMELTNDVQVLLPVMVSVMVSKWVGDFFTHPIFHAHLEMKCIPFLEPEPRVTILGKNVKLELHTVKEVMTSPVDTVREIESVPHLAQLLLHTAHGGFPVVRKADSGHRVFVGSITRLELLVLLMKEDLFTEGRHHIRLTPQQREISWVEYEELLFDKLANPQQKTDMLQHYVNHPDYENKYLDLSYYINESALSIPERFSLQRTYVIFRTLGLRHLTVVSSHGEVVGVVTRKDLMGFSIVEKLGHTLQDQLEHLHHHHPHEMTSPVEEGHLGGGAGDSVVV